MPSLYAMALRLTNNSTDAEDLVAEAVTKAWKSLHLLEQPDRFRPWI
ncbi:MAG: sigma factor [Candidatus Thiodiazotropha endolucinida]